MITFEKLVKANLLKTKSNRGLRFFHRKKAEPLLQPFSKGFTLLEILIALAAGSIILIVVAKLLVNGFLYNLIGFNSFNSQADAIAVLNRTAKEIRQGPAVVIANPQNITILEYLNLTDEAPYQIRFFLNGTDFIRGEIPPTGVGPSYTYDPASETLKTLATDIKNGANPVFTYYDQDGTALSSPIITGNVTLVKVSLSFGETNLRTAFTATTQAQLRFKKTNL